MKIMICFTASATIFTLQNSCNYAFWPGTLFGNGAAILGDGGFALPPGATILLSAPPGWSGSFWTRSEGNFSDAGSGQCTTGDCGGTMKCIGRGVRPSAWSSSNHHWQRRGGEGLLRHKPCKWIQRGAAATASTPGAWRTSRGAAPRVRERTSLQI